MPDEVFRAAAGVAADERAMIDHVWANVQKRNRWRLRAWRLINRVRAPARAILPPSLRFWDSNHQDTKNTKNTKGI